MRPEREAVAEERRAVLAQLEQMRTMMAEQQAATRQMQARLEAQQTAQRQLQSELEKHRAAPPAAPPAPLPPGSHHSVRALLAPLDGSYAIAAGSDMRARCWRLVGDASRSSVLVGQPADEPHPTYAERLVPGGCRVVRERQPSHAAGGAASLGVSHVPAPPIGINPGCTAAITSAAYCGGLDSGLLLLGSLDGTIRVWKPAMS
mmetsp:Transcript_19260/g.57468  ORF Transcript_19260/g.57468 Transcript_19260/m.57468 type:complete len:204 (+) Transcript_19260:149-760(+)